MKLIAYYRVSTDKQGQSGLGLEAQRERVQQFAQHHRHDVVEEIVEVQSGKSDTRPELARALAQARMLKAGIIVAKLDRLARSARFLDTVVNSGLDVLFCDLPNLPPGPTGRFMVQLMGSIAELEAGMISERTKAALRAAKARGKQLGGFRGTVATPQARQASAVARKAKADAHALAVVEHLQQVAASPNNVNEIAEILTQRQIETPSGSSVWNRQQVKRVIDRLRNIRQRDIQAAQSRATSTADWLNGTIGAQPA